MKKRCIYYQIWIKRRIAWIQLQTAPVLRTLVPIFREVRTSFKLALSTNCKFTDLDEKRVEHFVCLLWRSTCKQDGYNGIGMVYQWWWTICVHNGSWKRELKSIIKYGRKGSNMNVKKNNLNSITNCTGFENTCPYFSGSSHFVQTCAIYASFRHGDNLTEWDLDW